MARVGIVFGLIYCGLTFLALCTVQKTPALFVPMMIGIPVLFCGIVALNPHRRKVAMHCAAAIGTLGLVVGVTLAIHAGVSASEPAAVKQEVINLGLALAGLCFVFVMTCVFSFLQARSREQASKRLA